MRYEGTVYRPPSEAGSLLIQSTIGCPHNKCRFCGMYKNRRFRIRLLEDILEDLDRAGEVCGRSVRTLFLPDGNTIIMKTPSIIRILRRAYENFPGLERVTMYGSAKYLIRKSPDDLAELCREGLSRIHMGLESGDDETLARMCKGADQAESVSAGRRVREAGLELSAYYLVGIGGRDRWREHATASAEALNAMNPDFIRLRTYYPVKAAPLYLDIMEGRFTLPSPHEALRELELLVTGLEAPAMLLSDHVSNYVNLSGRIPEDKPEMLSELREALGRGEAAYARELNYL